MVSSKNERSGCRSLVCDSNGIIIAEMVYRCMICGSLSESICDSQTHYQTKHMHNDNPTSGENSEPDDASVEEYSELKETQGEDEVVVKEEKESSPQLQTMLTYSVPSGLKELQQLSPKAKDRRSLSDSQSCAVNSMAASALARAKNTMNGNKGGYVTCAVCNITKYYASVQRRYGQFTCMGCAKFFGRFLLKPRKYCCPKLGSCPLDATPRCKACLLLACIETYKVDDDRTKILDAHRPVRKLASSSKTNDCKKEQSELTQAASQPSTPATAQTGQGSLTAKGITTGSVTTTASTTTATTKTTVHETRSSRSGLRPAVARSTRTPSINSAVMAVLRRKNVKKNWGCRKCAGCLVEDCGTCHYCLDKPKFGGPNTLKKKCVLRRCAVQERQQRQRELEMQNGGGRLLRN